MPKLRVLLKVVKWTGVGILSIIILLIALAFIFEKTIKEYAKSYINNYLTTEIKVEDISFSFLKKFPQASLNFKNVYILDPPNIMREKDTLLYAGNIYLEFNIWDVLAGKYDVKSIEFNDAKVDLFIDQNKNENYKIWKTDSLKKVESRFSFALEKVKFNKTKALYYNYQEHTNISVYVNKLNFHGAFDNDYFDLKVSSKKISLKHLKINDYSIEKKYDLDFNLELFIDKTKNIIDIKKAKIYFEKMKFTANGIIGISNNKMLNVNITGDDINIKEVTESFKNIFPEKINEYETTGIIDFKLHVKRNKEDTPEINTSFSMENGSIKEKKSGISINKLSFSGRFNNTENKGGLIELKNIIGYLENSFFDMAIKVDELKEPKIDCYVKANINLETFYNFLKIDKIKKAKGIIDCDFSFNLNYVNRTNEFELKKAEGLLKIANVDLHSSLYKHSLEKCNGVFRLKESHAVIDEFTAKIGTSNIILNGVIQNFLSYYLGIEDKLNIIAQVESDNINLNELLQPEEGNNIVTNEKINLALPDNINLNLRLKVKQLIKDKFAATNISLQLILLDKKIFLKNFTSDYAKGKIIGNIEIDGTFENLFGFTADVKLKQVDVAEVFRQFDDFGQNPQATFISYKNISGKITTDASLGGLFDNELKIEKNKFYLTCDMTIENGELIKVPSLIEVARYLKNDKKTRLALGNKNIDDLEEKLNHIKFSTLSNHIDIKNQTVYIPKMDISSNVLNLKFSGTHAFSNEIDYRFNFRFNDLKKQSNNTEYGYIVDDGTGIKIYLRMHGHTDNLNYELDKNSIKEDLKEYNQQELKNIKGILKNEMGLFKKDTAAIIKETPKEQVKFLIEDDSKSTDRNNVDKKTPVYNKSEKENKRTGKIKQKLGFEEEKNKTKTVIEQ